MKLFIYGASGAGIETYDLAMRINKVTKRYSKVYLIDDFQTETDYYGTKRIWFKSCKNYIDNEEAEFVIAVGEPSARAKLCSKVKDFGFKLGILIDPLAVISETATISEGCIVNYGSVISSNVVLKENCFIMLEAIVGHDAVINRDSVICPKVTVGGYTIVGEQSFVGIGSSIMQKVNIGKKAIVGMGSMVFREVPDMAVVIGNPARVTKSNDEHKVFR